MERNREARRLREKQLSSPQHSLGTTGRGRLRETDTKYQILEDERKSEYPKIIINIFYSPHGSSRDLGGMDEQFRNADVYIPEQFGWNEEGLNLLRGLANGKIHPEDVRFPEDKREFYKMIYKSQKPITIIDVPENHPILNRQKKIKSPVIRFGTDFVESLDSVKKYFQECALIRQEREEYIYTQLRPQIRALLKMHPNLRDQKEIQVLLSLGGPHTFLYHSLKASGYQINRKFSKMPFVYPFAVEAERRYIFGREVNNLLASRVTTENALYRAFMPHFDVLTSDTHKIAELVRRFVSGFDFNEIKNMFESVEGYGDLPSKFEVELNQKGLRIPSSEKELDEFLARPISPQNKTAQK